MRVLVNALSVNNLSGRHVLLGHLERLADWTYGEHDYLVLYHGRNSDLCRDLGGNVDWQQCSDLTAHWAGRAAWEVSSLDRLAKKANAAFMFTPSGTVVPGFDLPQVSFAQNPWALVNGLDRSAAGHLKAALQRRNYRSAVRKAAMMIFNSEYMRGLYRDNAGREEQASAVVYQAVDDKTHDVAAVMRETVVRKPLQVLSVSAMAPHKGAETLVEAISLLHRQHGIPARLVMAGSWPDASYREKIENLIHQCNMPQYVDIRGHVDRAELWQLYAESQVFSLMSRCESFGIPAVEAQVFGTPVVSSDCCAIPEVCGQGGLFAALGDAARTAEYLSKLLSDPAVWEEYSEVALNNGARYRWESCSRGLLEMFDHI